VSLHSVKWPSNAKCTDGFRVLFLPMSDAWKHSWRHHLCAATIGMLDRATCNLCLSVDGRIVERAIRFLTTASSIPTAGAFGLR
jgi:hypothetical protein